MTNPVSASSQEKESITLSGYGFRVVLDGQGKSLIFNDKGEPVIDVAARMAVQKNVVLPFIQKLHGSWQQELNELALVTQEMALMSNSLNAVFTANDNAASGATFSSPQSVDATVQCELGQQVEDGSYYMGVSDTTGTDFFLFIESLGTGKHADVVTFNEGTQLMRQKRKQGVEFRGHRYSGQQLESEIVESYKDGAADGGIRRLTKAEWKQVEKVFEAKPELRAMALEVCAKDSWVQSASPNGGNDAWFQCLPDGGQPSHYRTNNASVLGGRSLPQPKAA